MVEAGRGLGEIIIKKGGQTMAMTNSRHLVVVAMLCSGLACADDEARNNLEQEKHGLMLEIEETEVRINQMRIEAMEHEALAKRLQAEAAKLELQMRREIQGRKRQLELAAAEVEVHGLLKEAERLEKRGHHDKAHELRAKAEGMAKMVHVRRAGEEGGEERDLHQREREIDELRERSEMAEREGRFEEAKQLWERAYRLAEELHRHHEPHERHGHMDRMHGRMLALGRAMEGEEREGGDRAGDGAGGGMGGVGGGEGGSGQTRGGDGGSSSRT